MTSLLDSAPLVDKPDDEFLGLLRWAGGVTRALADLLRVNDWGRLATALLSPPVLKCQPSARSVEKQALWSTSDADSPRSCLLQRAWLALPTDSPKRGAIHSAVPTGRRKRSAQSPLALLDRWAAQSEADELAAAEILMLLELLRDAGSRLPGDLAWRLWRIGHTAAVRLGKESEQLGEIDRLEQAELRWQAGLIYGPIQGAAELRARGQANLRRWLLDFTDSSGVPKAEAIDSLPRAVIALVRAREWGERFGRPLLGAAEMARFRALMSVAARICRRDGGLPFSNGHAKSARGLWATAASILDRAAKHKPAMDYLVQVNGVGTNGKVTSRNGKSKRSGGSNRSRPVFQSDESRVACLRSDWSSHANSLVVRHDGALPELELALRGRLLLSGRWGLEIAVDGRPLPLDASWECSCFHSDDDADYFELEMRLPDGVVVERQLLLAREDDLLIVADAISGFAQKQIDYVARLPIVADWKASFGGETREVWLQAGSRAARVVPLGLPCSLVQSAAGSLAAANQRIELRQSAIGGLFSPLVLDWNPDRRRQKSDWRPLTVGQGGQTVPSHEAVGRRLQIGKDQWLVYRALAPCLEPRSVLGHHTMYETVIGRFDAGTVQPLIIIKPSRS